MIRLPKPPKLDASIEELQWRDKLWFRVTGTSQIADDAAITIGSNTTYVGVRNLTAPRTLTLPSAADLNDPDELVIQDESGNSNTHNVTIQRSGTDTINGGASVTLSTNYGRVLIRKSGAGKFYSRTV